MLDDLIGYITPDPTNNDYKPSYLTKRLVINALGLVTYDGDNEKELYMDANEDGIFNLLKNFIEQ